MPPPERSPVSHSYYSFPGQAVEAGQTLNLETLRPRGSYLMAYRHTLFELHRIE